MVVHCCSSASRLRCRGTRHDVLSHLRLSSSLAGIGRRRSLFPLRNKGFAAKPAVQTSDLGLRSRLTQALAIRRTRHATSIRNHAYSLLGSYHIGILCFSAQALFGVLFGNDQLRQQDEFSQSCPNQGRQGPSSHPVNMTIPESYVAAARAFLTKRTYNDPNQFVTYTFFDPTQSSRVDINLQAGR